MVTNTNILEIIAKSKQDKLVKFYNRYFPANKTNITYKEIVGLCKNLILELELTSGDDKAMFESLGSLFKNYWKTRTIQEFNDIILGWISLNQLEYLPIKNIKTKYIEKLKILLKYYEKMKIHSEESDIQQLTSIQSQISLKIKQFSKIYHYDNPQFVFRNNLLKKEIQNLKEIFEFYANSNVIFGKFTTFDGFKEQANHWTCGIFIKFCSVFGLYKSNKNCPGISQKSLISIYLNHSYFKKSMTLKFFIKSLDEIAAEYFKSLAAHENLLDFSVLSLQEKKIMLLETIKLGNTKHVKMKLKNSVLCFATPDYKSRILPEDPSNTYRFTASKETKEKLHMLKVEKAKKLKTLGKKAGSGEISTARNTKRPCSSYIRVKSSPLLP